MQPRSCRVLHDYGASDHAPVVADLAEDRPRLEQGIFGDNMTYDVAVMPSQTSAASGPLVKRTYAGGYYGLALDGVQCGLLQKVEGGWASATVVQEKVASDHVIKKHLAGMSFSEFNLQMGLAMGKGVYQWIENTLNNKHSRHNGSIQAADFEKFVRESQEFTDALITEVTFPACDGSSKDPAFLGLKFQPESVKRSQPSGSLKLPAEPLDYRQKMLFPSAFRLTIDGVNCREVSKIDAVTMKQIVVDNPVGEARTYEREPGHIEFPNIKLTVADAQADDFWLWYDSFVIQGICQEKDEKAGSLEYLDAARKKTLIELPLQHLGVFNVTPDSQSASARAGIRRVTFELYCEEMKATFFPGSSDK